MPVVGMDELGRRTCIRALQLCESMTDGQTCGSVFEAGGWSEDGGESFKRLSSETVFSTRTVRPCAAFPAVISFAVLASQVIHTKRTCPDGDGNSAALHSPSQVGFTSPRSGAVQAGPKLHKGKYALQRNISSIKTTQVHSVRDREQIIVAVNSLCKLFFHTLRGEGSGVNPHIEG